MKLLVNDKEIANYLASIVDVYRSINGIKLENRNLAETIKWILEGKNKKKVFDQRIREKARDKIYSSVAKDLKAYVDKVNQVLENHRSYYYQNIHKHLDYFLKRFNEEEVINNYKQSNINGFIKSVGLHLDPSADLVRRKYFNNINTDCLLRNTVGNEQFLISKIDNKLPFWFIDSGYTNFLESNKKWHRLVRNHLHIGNYFEAPVDRLGNFKSFPRQWRDSGDKILVVEPGLFAASIFHVDIKTWKYKVEEELRKYTDKKIVFREKAPKKQRAPLYKHLLDEDYYCVVNINSNAATEAIWAGVPVITLDKHITNSVSKNSLSDINTLYRGPLANWLAMLSYSQFTYEELIDGTAVNILRTYHE